MKKLQNTFIKIPVITIDEETKLCLRSQTQEESQVIVHCTFTSKSLDYKIRIWDSTFLICSDTSHKSQLLHAEDISYFPAWMEVELGATVYFTLIFSGLPKDCIEFDLIEDIPEPGGFAAFGIKRNSSDVYYVEWE